MNSENLTGLEKLLREGPQPINLGLRGFGEALRHQGVQVIHVEWSPPPPEVRDLEDLLDELLL